MQVANEALAIHYLSHLNYYRLGAYWLPFEQHHSSHQFRPGTQFDDALNLYIFDRELRLWLMDAIERIEVSLRTQFAYQLSLRYGTHPHLNQALFHDPARYSRAYNKLENEVKQSGEEFIKHLTQKYQEPLPPIWAIVELMSIGQLSQWYDNLQNRQDRKIIADIYDIDEKNLRTFLHHLTTLRNHCAHHARVWNRDYTVTLKIPNKRPASLVSSFNHQPHSGRKLYNTLVLLAYLMDLMSPGHHWKKQLLKLIKNHSINPHLMGFPSHWLQLPIWTTNI
ncbi:MAG: Abi family protein [Methylovulum sp.]|nr:Abi family protein [Methylovulum sp.]